MTIARAAMRSPCVMSRTRSFKRSHERNLLSTARLNNASSRVRAASYQPLMLYEVSLTKDAERDLEEIYVYIA